MCIRDLQKTSDEKLKNFIAGHTGKEYTLERNNQDSTKVDSKICSADKVKKEILDKHDGFVCI